MLCVLGPDGTSRTNRSNSKLALPSFVNLGDSLHGLSNSIHSALGDNRVNYSRVAVDRDSLVKLREELGITVTCIILYPFNMITIMSLI